MIDHMLPLLSSFLDSGFAVYFYFPLIALAFIATVPCILRKFIMR